MESFKAIRCATQPFGVSFHPSRHILAAGLVDGHVEGELIYNKQQEV